MTSNLYDFSSIRRQIRAITILDGAEEAGLTPLPVVRFHNIAFLTNVLAPVWEIPVMEGRVLKRDAGPFYPLLQHDLDRLVGAGVVTVDDVGHVMDEAGRWRIDASYQLNWSLASPIVDALKQFQEEAAQAQFVREVVFAASALSDDDLDRLAQVDATYGDVLLDVGNVVDFAEWSNVNYAATAANMGGRLMLGGTRATQGEKVHIYLRHLQRRLRRAE